MVANKWNFFWYKIELLSYDLSVIEKVSVKSPRFDRRRKKSIPFRK